MSTCAYLSYTNVQRCYYCSSEFFLLAFSIIISNALLDFGYDFVNVKTIVQPQLHVDLQDNCSSPLVNGKTCANCITNLGTNLIRAYIVKTQ